MTQKERQERSRKEIYQAALEEFGTYGYDKVNMERICGNHGISKGMMYHYYSNKDELFLLCVERTFQELRAHVERDMAHLSGEDTAAAVKDFFMIRECFFQLHPQQKLVFESAMLRPPKHLTRYLETIESLFQNMIVSYQGGHPAQDFHAMLETAGELLNMVLFGILRHADPA